MKFYFLANVIFLISLNSSYANCEAGSYSIHTVAEYGLAKNLFIVKGKPEKLSKLRNEVKEGTYKTDNPKCQNITISKISAPKKESSNEPTEVEVDVTGEEITGPFYKLEGCKLSDSAGFFMFDTDKKKVSFSKPVEVKKIVTTEKINLAIKNQMETIKLQPLVGPSDHSKEKVIAKADIKNFSNFPIESTQVGNKMTMSVANLDIIHLEKYFADEGYRYYGEKYFNFEKRMAVFPVIFFTLSDRTSYIGDGAWCSQVPVIYNNISLTDRELSKNNPKYIKSNHAEMAKPDEYKKDQDGYFNLGKIHEYGVTGAYDFNDDGKPDILIMNGLITYYLQEDGGLVVLESPEGC